MLETIIIESGPLTLSSLAEVNETEQLLGFTFPTGYTEFVTGFGEGILGDYIRIYPPKRITGELKGWRERIAQYWFWDADRETLTHKQAMESIIIGDTLDGDELITHPSNPECIYVLPRSEETIFIAGNGLFSAIEWLCNSGVLTEAFMERGFEPF